MTTLLWYWERKNIILAHLYYFVSVHSTDKQKDTDVKEHANYYFSVLLKYIFSERKTNRNRHAAFVSVSVRRIVSLQLGSLLYHE